MTEYRFKKALLVSFSLVLAMAACGGSSGSGGSGSHASISTDPDNPSKLTFPETAENSPAITF